jgi:hypothetical protein
MQYHSNWNLRCLREERQATAKKQLVCLHLYDDINVEGLARQDSARSYHINKFNELQSGSAVIWLALPRCEGRRFIGCLLSFFFQSAFFQFVPNNY